MKSRKTPEINSATNLEASPLTIGEQIAVLLNRKGEFGEISTITAAELAAIRTILNAKSPKEFNPDSVANLTARYNELVETATALGLRAKFHSSLFGSVAGGKDQLAKLEAAIAAKQVTPTGAVA
jgi:hypothetical protein